MHAPLQVCCVFSVTIRVTFDFFFSSPSSSSSRSCNSLFSLRSSGRTVELSLLLLLFFCPSQAAQLCNFGRDVVRVATVSVFLGEGALSSAYSVDLLQVESSAAARSVRSQRTAVCRNARERRNHCAEMNSLCHDPRQLRPFHPHRPSFGLRRWMCVHHYCHACPISGYAGPPLSRTLFAVRQAAGRG